MQQGFDINVLRKEAKSRWLKPTEVFFLLQNFGRIPLTQEPPDRPQSGSLFLFNRRILRFFRKDGHAWRRKKDGRAVGEAHERLKVGNVDVLNCYYAHGEKNPYFQRRSFWMLDPAYDHIVLVQYLDVSEGRYVSGSISNLSPESYYNANTSKVYNGFTTGNSDSYEPYQNYYSPGSAEEGNSKFVIEKFESRNTRITEVNRELRKLAQQLSLDDDVNYYSENSIPDAHEDFPHGNNELSEPYQSSYTAGSSEETHQKFLEGNLGANQNSRFDSDQSSQPHVNQALWELEQQLSLESLNGDGHLVHLEEPFPRKEDQSHLGFLHYERREKETYENISEGLEVRAHGQVKEVEECQSYASTHLPKVSGNNGSEQSERLCMNFGIETEKYSSWTDMLKLSSTTTGISTDGTTSDVLVVNDIPESSNCRDQCCSSSEKRSDGLLLQSENMPWYAEDNRFATQVTSESDLLQLSAARKFLLGSDDYEDFLTRNIPLQTSSRNDATIDWMGSSTVGDIAYLSEFSSTMFEDGQSQSSLGIDSSLTLARKQLFSIREISPEWAYAGDNTKVIITGDFLCNPTELSLKAMFGDIEVPLQIVQEGVIRCQTPQCHIGKVTLCITSGNRQACSEIREFEFRPKPCTTSYSDIMPAVDATTSNEELLLLARLVQIVLYGFDISAVTKGAINPQLENAVKLEVGNSWHQMIESLNCGCASSFDSIECIVEELLKDKLPYWLSSKDQRDEQTNCSLSKQELGIIHMISGLGYEWALSSILNTGVNVNFRDTNGWTALHWAAYYGREKMVAALLAASASPGAATDPTPQDPVGKTPGFLASVRGHKGLAGYLSEVALTSHLSSLTVEETEISKVSAEVEAEKAVESISQKGVEMHGETEDELSLKDSLAAVRNAAQAAARIQAAFRAHSFRRRQQVVAFRRDDYGMTPRDIQELSAASKYHRSLHGSQDQRFDKAALSIQKNYRGWKGHKEFLTLKKNVVKIQAHVRGHQVRKKYRDLIFTVSFVEKAILRWRRKGVGLRGFRAEPEAEPEMVEDEEEEEDIAKVFRKQKVDAALDEAVSRVLSMVDSPDARQQYRRMIERYHEAKAELCNPDEGASRIKSDFEVMDNDMY